MSGAQIGGVIGAAIGFFTPIGPVWGYAIGSAIGGVVDPTKIDGPRLQDRKVQVSSYGAPIPILYGGTAGAGNVIWSTDLVEHDVESDGKGGRVVTNHTYSVSCAILIAEGVIPGIRRIWADAKLVYDVSDTADGPTQIASVLFDTYCTFYTGSESQLPDPTMEAALGAGNVSAYRGYCYIVFTDIPLQDFGNRIPNFRFETSAAPADIPPDDAITYEPLKVYNWVVEEGVGAGAYAIHPKHAGETHYYDVVSSGYSGTSASAAYAAYSAAQPLKTAYQGYYDAASANAPILSAFPGAAGQSLNATSGIDLQGSSQYAYGVYNHESVTAAFILIDFVSGPAYRGACATFFAGGITPSATQSYLTANLQYGYPIGQLMRLFPDFASVVAPFTTEGSYHCGPEYGGGTSPVFGGSGHRTYRSERLPSVPPDLAGCGVGDPCLIDLAQIPGQPGFCIDCFGEITPSTAVTYTKISGTFKQLGIVTYAGGVLTQNGVGPVHLPSDPEYNDSAYWDAQATLAIAEGTLLASSAYPVVVSEVAQGTGVAVAQIIADEANTTLDLIVSDICRRAGMEDEDSPNVLLYDVTELEGIEVQGYDISRQMPARAAILQLQQTFWWDFVESGRVIKAVLRGGASAASIGLDDLGATEGDDSAVAVVPNRGQETELPATVNVAYPVRASGYEPGAQRARRITTGSQQILSLEIAVVMTDQRAAEVADVLMYLAWTNRTQRSWSTTREYSHLEPTDVVTLNDGEFTYVCRITERSEEGPVIKWGGVDEKPATYSPIVSPATSGIGIGGVGFAGPMKLELIDSPILIDTNDDPGFYAAVAGYRDGWPGGSAFRSIDDGATYANVRSMSNVATMGYALTVLGDWDGGNTVDEANTVNVRMHSGTLSTITQAQLLNQGNAALLGDELIHFKRAELLAPDIYKLSGLLRGRKGTEQHQATHAAADRFVLLNAAIYRVPGSLADLDVPAVWKGVTSGQTLDNANEIDFTNTGAGLMPLSPVHLHAIDIGGGQYRVNWVRRSRIGGKWRDVATPLGETSESYAVVVNSDAAVITGASTLDVTATTGDTVTVQQISTSVGPGFPAEVTIV